MKGLRIMSLDKVYVLPHPPLAIPDVGRGQEKGIGETIKAFREVADQIAGERPETIVFITPHNVLYADYFHISPGPAAHGDFSRFNAPGTKLEARYDQEMAEAIIEAANREGISTGNKGEKDASLDHGTTVPMWFINERFSDYSAIRISQSGMNPSEHYRLGMVITEVAARLGRKTVLIASSDLSHKLKSDGPYGYTPEGPEFDVEVVKCLKDGDFLALMQIPESTLERAAECGYNSLMVMAGCFDRRNVKARVLSYEGTYGVGYAIAAVEAAGPDEGRNILDKHMKITLDDALLRREAEDDYRALARKSLEYTIAEGRDLTLPKGLPDEMVTNKAGVFVTLYKNERLRGCIGTIAPNTQCIALEIIRNAVSAGLNDTRFDPVSPSELPYLTYKVDVLSEPEPISGPEELDVKRYGVIVTSGSRRGLLLPNLDGVDTVREQIEIARQKAGIPEGMQFNLERFEVTRHE